MVRNFHFAGVVVVRHPLPAPSSAAVAFTSSAGTHWAYIACLDGSVLGLEVRLISSSGMKLQERWKISLPSPVFADPLVLRAPLVGAIGDEAMILMLAVSGHLVAVNAAGERLWQTHIEGGGTFLAPLAFESEALALVATQGGALHRVDLKTGKADALPWHLPADAAAVTKISHNAAALSTIEGHVLVVTAAELELRLKIAVKAPAAVFSLAPGPSPDSILIGCRDDYLYLAQLYPFNEYY